MLYPNKLCSCIFTLKESRVNVRCVSHLATTPKDVRDWVPVNLKELGDTVVIDRRTVEVMDGMDIEFVLQPQTRQIVGIEVRPPDDQHTHQTRVSQTTGNDRKPLGVSAPEEVGRGPG